MVKIIETFLSLQGEGILTGKPTYFIRTGGCSLNCSYCDTKYAFAEGIEKDVKDVVNEAFLVKCKNICVTGGEPLEQPDILDLCAGLIKYGKLVSVETNGSKDVRSLIDLGDSLMVSMDIKCPSSNMEKHNKYKNLSYLRPRDQVKFTIELSDTDFVEKILEEYPTDAEVVIQPVFGASYEKLAQWVIDSALDVRFMLQTHKIIWAPDARGV